MALKTRRLPATVQALAKAVAAELAAEATAEGDKVVLDSGTATLASGVKAITGLTDITANAEVRLRGVGVLKAAPYVKTITAGTGFTIATDSSADTGKVFWEVLAW